MTKFEIYEQVDPTSNQPFRIIEIYMTSEGYRSRIVGERFSTLERAKGEVEALQAALQASTAAETPRRAVAFIQHAHNGPPPPPWPPGRDNAKRHGWLAYFEGKECKSPFPPNREDLRLDFLEGWEVAKNSGLK